MRSRIDAWAGREGHAGSGEIAWFVGVEVDVVDGAKKFASAYHHMTPDEADAFADRLREEAHRARHHEKVERRRLSQASSI